MILWASRRREIWTGTSSRPMGGAGILVCFAQSPPMAMVTPPRSCTRSRDGVDDFYLLFEVLIEEEMELVEGGAGDLPVGLLVHVAKGDGIGEKLVELLAHIAAHFGVEGVWKVFYRHRSISESRGHSACNAR